MFQALDCRTLQVSWSLYADEFLFECVEIRNFVFREFRLSHARRLQLERLGVSAADAALQFRIGCATRRWMKQLIQVLRRVCVCKPMG